MPCFLTSGQKDLLEVRPMYAHNLVEYVIDVLVAFRRPCDGFDHTMVSSNGTNLFPDFWLPVLDGLTTPPPPAATPSPC